MRAENSALPCRDGCPIQVIRSPSSPKNLSRRNPHVFATLRWFGLGSPIVPVVQPSRSRMRKDVARGYGASSSVWRSLSSMRRDSRTALLSWHLTLWQPWKNGR